MMSGKETRIAVHVLTDPFNQENPTEDKIPINSIESNYQMSEEEVAKYRGMGKLPDPEPKVWPEPTKSHHGGKER